MNNKILRRSYQKKIDLFKRTMIEPPSQGWIKTLREIFGMTTTQLAKKLNISQPRVIKMEQNEKNLKISTLEKIADELCCDFVYAFIPREKINDIIHKQAKKCALKILNRVNKNMSLENQLSESEEILEDLIEDLLDGNISKIWNEDN